MNNGSPDGGALHAISNHYAGSAEPWTEDGVTWSNAPAMEGSPLDALGAVSSGSWIEYDVSAAVTADGSYSFGIRSGSSNSLYLDARESGANAPRLVVELAPAAASADEGARVAAPRSGPLPR